MSASDHRRDIQDTYIHGSTDDREVARLEKQAHLAWEMVRPHFVAEENERVLDLATGVGAMAGRLMEDFPSVRLVGLDLRMSQLQRAHQNHPGAAYVNADGTALPFRDGTFDRVHCSWLLEHVRAPVPILREVRRVLRPGGTAHFIEVDNATFRVVPHDPEIQSVMDDLNRAQVEGGGDPFVGQKLDRYFAEAGFSQLQLSRSRLHGTAADPRQFQRYIEEFAEIFESIDEALGPENVERIRHAAEKLRAYPSIPGAEFHYAGVIAVGTK